MTKKANISFLLKGKTQSDRLLPALAPKTFQVDDRNSLDLLAFTSKFAKAFKYFNPINKTDGSWQELLLDDPSVLLAYIVKTNHFMEFPRFLDYKAGIEATKDFNTKKLFAQQFFSIGFHVVLRINRWYKLSNKAMTYHAFRDYLNQIIGEEGRQALSNYYLIYFKLSKWIPGFKNQSLTKLEDLDRIWLFEPFPCIKEKDPKTERDNLIEDLILEAVKTGQSLFHLQEKIIEKANASFKNSLERSDISPHIGLLLTFLDLYKYQQDDLNNFTEKHLDFYFDSILGFKPISSLPDITHVQLAKGTQFQKNDGQHSYVLPQDTKLSGGNDSNGEPVVFSTKNTLTITKGILSQYLTLAFNIGDSADRNNPSPIIKGLYSGSVQKIDSLKSKSWPFFGSTKSIDPNYKIKEEKKTLGFAISCPELILNSGDRSITFTFFKNKNEKAPKLDVQSFPLFDFQLTIATGWKLYKGECVSVTDKFVKFKLKLLTNEPAIVPYNEKVHKAGLLTEHHWPVCKITLANDAPISVFNQLNKFKFENVEVDVNVKGAESLVLQNDKGKVSPKAAFYPFGSIPVIGLNLFIGSQELFNKPLDEIDFNILWNQLPDNFKSYYKGYPGIYLNDSFQATLSYFCNQIQDWKTLKDKNGNSHFSLFTIDKKATSFKGEKETANASNDIWHTTDSLLLEKKISIPIKTIFAQSDLPPISAYSQSLSSAFFKLTLVEPNQGFGVNDYPQLLSQITLENGQAIIWNAKQYESNPLGCKSIEKIYQEKAKFEHLEIQLVNEVGKLDQIGILMAEGLTEILEIQSGCEIDAIKTELLEGLFGKVKDEVLNIINTCETDVLQILEESFDLLEKMFTSDPELMENIEKSGTKKKDKDGKPSSKLDSFFNSLTKKIPSSLIPGSVRTGVKILEGANKILGSIFKKKNNGEVKPKGLINRLFKKNNKNDSQEEDHKKRIAELFGELETAKLTLLEQFSDKMLNRLVDSVLKEHIDGLKVMLNKWLNSVNTQVKDFKEDIVCFSSFISAKINILELLIEGLSKEYIPLKPLPNKPFVPKIKALSVDYQSGSKWKAKEEREQLNFDFFHLEPFGHKKIEVDNSPLSLFPHLEHIPYTFLGFKDLKPEESITILINITSQVKSMSAASSGQINYQYLSTDGWQNFKLDADGTYGLEQSGIIQFIVPKEITDQSTLMPKGVFWIRLNRANDHKSNLKITTNFIGTHAVTVQRNLNTNTSEQSPKNLLNQADVQQLKIGTIKVPVSKINEVKKIQQPLPSFGGRQAETKEQTYQRAAYRLNNKNRAVTTADMENLILQTFDSLYQAIAIPMRHFDGVGANVLKVVLISFTNLKSEHPYRPLVGPLKMREVLGFSEQYRLPSMELEIVNPDFYTIEITVEVKYNSDNDQGLLKKKLNQDLIYYLSPWLKDNPIDDEQYDVNNKAAMRAFILSRSYIDEVGGLTFIIKNEETNVEKYQDELRPWDLLVPAFEHNISDQNIKNGGMKKTRFLKDKANYSI